MASACPEFDPAKLFAAALLDQARKHRKRPPEDAKKIEAARRGANDARL